MFLRVVNSGSDGNGYVIGNEKEFLILEAGERFRKVKKATGYNITGIQGICVSHMHTDHYKYIQDYRNAGIPAYMPFEDDRKSVQFGGFEIWSFTVEHDVPTYGFLVEHDELGKLLFATDTFMIQWNFRKLKLNHIMIECNYQKEYVSDDEIKRDRVYRTHMELGTTIDFIKANVTDSLRNVILMHLSDESSQPVEMLDAVSEAVPDGVNVHIARKGLEVLL